MGACLSSGGGKPILTVLDGGDQEYKDRFQENRVLGEGEFGVVKLVHDKKNKSEEYACKTLRKTAVFKNNELFAPMPPEILRGEIEMLQTLAGNHFCLKVVSVYETPKIIFLVTECCSGGEMMQYVAKQTEDLRSEDVSRMAFQLLDALGHCAQNKILHRDIKPENVMFKSSDPGSELRLIDFGSGTMCPSKSGQKEGFYSTFAGTPFYNSPEMFRNLYSQKTDVWSVGVTLYVLVAGYPSDQLQKAFNMLLNAKRKTTKELPNMPNNMPEAYYGMLDELLTYQHTKRKSAKDILSHEFVQFHREIMKSDEDIDGEEKDDGDKVSDMPTQRTRRSTILRQQSISLKGTVRRHSLFLDFQKFERSLTTLLATMLSKTELSTLLAMLKKQDFGLESAIEEEESEMLEDEAQLDVVLVGKLKSMMEKDINNQSIIKAIENLPGASSYDQHAYHIKLIQEFAPKDESGSGDRVDDEKNKNLREVEGLKRGVSTFSMGRQQGGRANPEVGMKRNLMSKAMSLRI